MPALEITNTFARWLGNVTVELSCCILLILLIRTILGRFLSARTRRALWLVLFIPCLIPWSFKANLPATMRPLAQ